MGPRVLEISLERHCICRGFDFEPPGQFEVFNGEKIVADPYGCRQRSFGVVVTSPVYDCPWALW